jgi:ubiquitin carboxyl-terminal hydrolase 5/13
MQMGVPELGAKHALYKTGNNSADMAVAWFFENMDNPVINEPLMVKKASSKGGDNIP